MCYFVLLGVFEGVEGAGSDVRRATLYAGDDGGAGDDPLCALCMLEAVESGYCLLEVFDVPEVMHCMLLCMLEAFEVPEVMRCVLSVCWKLWRVGSVRWRFWGRQSRRR